MNYEDSNIFDNIVTNENSLTELFRNFLRFKIFREAFVNLVILNIDKSEIIHDDFQTQFYTANNGIPDLVLSTEDYEYVFEIKVHNTGLTNNQPLGYLDYLRSIDKPNKGLFLIAPENYIYKNVFFDRLVGNIKDTDNVKVEFISWQSVMKLITDNELDETSPLFSEYLYYLNYWFKTIEIDKLNSNIMYSKDFPDSINKICELIDRAADSLKSGSTLKKSNEGFLGEYGYYIKDFDDYELFYGIWFPYWKSTGNPITICIKSNNADKLVKFENVCTDLNLPKPITANDLNDWHCTYVTKDIIEQKNCAIIIADKMNELKQRMK